MHLLHSSFSLRLAFLLGLGVVLMLGLAFASVPLYRLFCQKTGYGGTPKISKDLPQTVGGDPITVQFNADLDPNLEWEFHPLQRAIRVRPGELGLAYYHVNNRSTQPVRAMATYNVTPERAANFFNKVDCFCFEEQVIPALTEADLPVLFFLDPSIATAPQTRQLHTITLSYTFFKL